MDKMRKELMHHLAFMSYAPILFLSAQTGQRVDRLFELIQYVYGQNTMRISTGMLNDVLADATARVQPPSDKGKRLKIYYITQASTQPPTFVYFCNNAELFLFLSALSGKSDPCYFRPGRYTCAHGHSGTRRIQGINIFPIDSEYVIVNIVWGYVLCLFNWSWCFYMPCLPFSAICSGVLVLPLYLLVFLLIPTYGNTAAATLV